MSVSLIGGERQFKRQYPQMRTVPPVEVQRLDAQY
jgi:hypothetical protein